MLANNVRLFVTQEERLERLCVCTVRYTREGDIKSSSQSKGL